MGLNKFLTPTVLVLLEGWKKDFEPFPNHYKEWRYLE